MARKVNGVGPRRLDERVYDRNLRRLALTPLMAQLRSGLSEASAASLVLEIIDGVFRRWGMGGFVNEEVAAHSARVSGYHRRRLIQTFRTALGIDIRPMLLDSAIAPLMSAWRQENISLIRTIPERFHGALSQRVGETFAQQPFGQQALSKVLNREFKVSGSNLRRITRDQTSKAIGQLTHARHRQLGIQEYTWRTAEDERVRATHVALNGTRQSWDSGPGVGHPGSDILCRCVAIPVIEEADG